MPSEPAAAPVSLGVLHHARQRHRTAPRSVVMVDGPLKSIASADDLFHHLDVCHAADHAAGRYGSGAAEDDAVHYANPARRLYLESLGRTQPLLGCRKCDWRGAAARIQSHKVRSRDARASAKTCHEEALRLLSIISGVILKRFLCAKNLQRC